MRLLQWEESPPTVQCATRTRIIDEKFLQFR
jgi:hypothetical protein